MKKAPQTKPPPTRGRPSRRPQIIAATENLLRTKGLGSVTTRAIAEEVGCSEAAIYVHFRGRLQLLLAVLEESLPDMLIPLQTLEQAIGKSTPEKNLKKALRAIAAFHERVTPMFCSLFADPELLIAYRKTLTVRGKGPHGGVGRLRNYIQAEQNLNRIDPTIDAATAATTLMAASFFRAFTEQFLGTNTPFDTFANKTLHSILRSITQK
ncbi:TetR/AcrR family transcriptional regulator [Granulicella sp. dw_53]|uniref:TetR/AcrR family transcriptional regulator n=1 Tax=Granulicella sp. dw_53 TaxID=2719792 RepID=UPI001BD2A896|nr:TetR/AcrR family transcriptional regulator [Granulicella sp. dw_53]